MYPMEPSRTNSDRQRFVLKSNSMSFLESNVIATMWRPSGDQRGAKIPREPSSSTNWRVCRFNMRIAVSPALSPRIPKANELPSGDHAGSPEITPSEVNCSAEPPSLEINQTFHEWPGDAAAKAMRCASGDHRGMVACMGEVVSWSRSSTPSLVICVVFTIRSCGWGDLSQTTTVASYYSYQAKRGAHEAKRHRATGLVSFHFDSTLC